MGTLFEAWQQWGVKELTNEFNLWWWSILWWGRIGKALAAAGILGFGLEVIGHRRISRFGEWLKNAVQVEAEAFSSGFGDWTSNLATKLWELVWPGKPISPPETEQDKAFRQLQLLNDSSPCSTPSISERLRDASQEEKVTLVDILLARPWAALLWLSVSSAGFVSSAMWLQVPSKDFDGFGLWLMVFVGIFVFIGPAATWLIAVAAVRGVLIFNIIVISPIANAIKSRRFNFWIQLGIFWSLVIGFHFDLLAS